MPWNHDPEGAVPVFQGDVFCFRLALTVQRPLHRRIAFDADPPGGEEVEEGISKEALLFRLIILHIMLLKQLQDMIIILSTNRKLCIEKN